MKESFRIAAAVVIALALGPRGTAQSGSDTLFPTGQGSKWVYSGTAGKSPIETTAEITSSKTVCGVTTVVVRWDMAGKETQTETYLVSATGVRRARSGRAGANKIDPPIPVIVYPMTVGKSWKWKGSITLGTGEQAPKTDGSADLRVAAKEKVRTGPGEFTAFKVDLSLTISAGNQSQNIPNSYWFAPGKGLIKQSSDIKIGADPTHIEAAASAITIK